MARRKLKPFKIALWCVLGAILLFICIALGSLLVQKYIKKSKVPMFMGYASMRVITDSMNGTIDKGDLVIVKKSSEYKLGEIVTFIASNGEVITHRLVNYGAQEGTFVTKGDANPTTDGNDISIDQIAGKVVFTIPKLGLVFDWFLYDGGVIYLAAMLAIIIAGVYFWNQTKAPEKESAASEDGSSETDDENK